MNAQSEHLRLSLELLDSKGTSGLCHAPVNVAPVERISCLETRVESLAFMVQTPLNESEWSKTLL